MSFSADRPPLLEECDALSADTTLTTPFTNKRFEIIKSQGHRITIKFITSGQARPLQREQFETLVDQINSPDGVFDFQRLPSDAEPYAVVLSLHPRYECDKRDGTITGTDGLTRSQLTEHDPISSTDTQECAEPDLGIYTNMLPLVDALERHDPTALSESEAPALISLYTLPSDVQRNAGDPRQAVREALLDRPHRDQSAHSRCGSM